ncbi:hypothetical protein IPM65_00325 [Candidatus Roizmanbacteria bacterium]|nr:MAG: hypothetical protein IPM65_00325 [Candidatus Roizmanbacteria bacterium]
MDNVAKIRKTVAIVVALAVIAGGATYVFIQANASNAKGVLAFTVNQNAEYRVGQTDPISVPIRIATDNADIYGADISLTFSPSILRLIDIVPFDGSTTLQTFLPQKTDRSFDKDTVLTTARQSGLVSFSVVATDGGVPSTYNGNTIIATLLFEPITEGQTTLSWNAVAGQTDDSNIVETGEIPSDILSTSENAGITILPASANVPTSTPTTAPTWTPVPPTATLTPTKTPTAIPTRAPTATPTRVPLTTTPIPTQTPVPSPTAPQGEQTVTYQITDKNDDVYEDILLYRGGRSVWLGRGLASQSYSAFRFKDVSLPKSAQIMSAYLEMNSSGNSWISVDVTFAFENTADSAAFSNSSMPSSRTLTTNSARMSENVQWKRNQSYRSPDISSSLQELVNRSDWGNSNTISLIGVGNGSRWSRKKITSFEGSAARAVRLVITYR